LRLLHSTSASYAILTRPRRRLQPSAAQHGACMRSPRWNIISPAAALSRADSGAFAHFACESAIVAPPVAARPDRGSGSHRGRCPPPSVFLAALQHKLCGVW